MLDTPQIIQLHAQKTAIIRITVAREQIHSVMEPAMVELLETLRTMDIEPDGPIFSHHLCMDPNVFDFEVGVPVAEEIEPTGRVVPGVLPATTVVRTIYHGGYEGLGLAWGEFRDWIARNGHPTQPDLWECYASGPAEDPDPSAWCTELYQPLLAAA